MKQLTARALLIGLVLLVSHPVYAADFGVKFQWCDIVHSLMWPMFRKEPNN
jgi:hypothetical protein